MMKRAKRKPRPTNPKKAKRQSQPSRERTANKKLTTVQELAHLLQVNQFELEHQNQELRITEAELEVSRNRYVNLFDFSPIPLVVLGADGAIAEVNVSASKLFGKDRGRLMGRPFIMLVPPDNKPLFAAFFKTVFSSPGKHSCRLSVVGKDKTIRQVQLEGIVQDDVLGSDQQCQMALIDLTDRRQGD